MDAKAKAILSKTPKQFFGDMTDGLVRNKAHEIAKLARAEGQQQILTTLLIRLLWLTDRGDISVIQAQTIFEPFRELVNK